MLEENVPMGLGRIVEVVKTINRISTDSIQNIDDVKRWARENEIRADHRFDQIQAAIAELKELDECRSLRIATNTKMILISSIGFGVVLSIVVLLFGIKQIIGSF